MELIGGVIAFCLFIYGLIVTFHESALMAILFFFLPPIPVVVGILNLFGINVPRMLIKERDAIVSEEKQNK